MPSEEFADVLRHWVRHGPRDRAGLVEFAFGMWCWWRTWVFVSLLGAGMVASVWLTEWIQPAGAAMAAFVVGTVVGKWLLKFSPKYNVTKNY